MLILLSLHRVDAARACLRPAGKASHRAPGPPQTPSQAAVQGCFRALCQDDASQPRYLPILAMLVGLVTSTPSLVLWWFPQSCVHWTSDPTPNRQCMPHLGGFVGNHQFCGSGVHPAYQKSPCALSRTSTHPAYFVAPVAFIHGRWWHRGSRNFPSIT